MKSGSFDNYEGMIPIGRIIKPHGLRGEVKAKIAIDNDEVFRKFKNAVLSANETSLVKVRIDGSRKAVKGWILHFEGFENLSQVERLCGYYIYVERDYLPELAEGEYYFFQVLGCQVRNESGDFVGTVEDIIETGSNDVMVIRRQDGFNVHEELIPLIKDYIVSMDFERKIVIARSLDYEEVR